MYKPVYNLSQNWPERLKLWQTELVAALRLAIPLSTVQLAEGTVSIVDTIMMGWIGSYALAAGGLGATIFLTVLQVCLGLIEGTGALAADAFGRDDKQKISQVTTHALWLCLATSCVTIPLLWQVGTLLPLLGQTTETAVAASDYLHAVVWSFPAAMGLAVFKEITSVLGKAQWITAISITIIPCNAVLNYGLAFGHWGLPALGLSGLGWASTFVFWLAFGIAIVIFFSQPDFQALHLHQYVGIKQVTGQKLNEIFQLGWPLMVQFGIELGLFTVAALMMGYWSETELAAYEIAISVLDIIIMIPWGIAYAASIRVAKTTSSSDFNDRNRVAVMTISLALGIAALIMILLLAFPEEIASIYLDHEDPRNSIILDLSTSFLKLTALLQLLYGIHLVASGILLGLLDSLGMMMINSGAYFLVGAGGGYVLGEILGWHSLGLWWGIISGILVADILLAVRIVWLFRKHGDQTTLLDQSALKMLSK